MKTHAKSKQGNAVTAAPTVLRFKTALTAVSVAVFIAGCGGGGGSDGSTASSVANDATAAQTQLSGNLGNQGVIPPQSVTAGRTYSQWSTTWWQWAVKRPAGAGPLDDETGQLCGLDQSGPVWFLAASGGFRRTCHVPAGKFIFFPLVVAEWSKNEADYYGTVATTGAYCPGGPQSAQGDSPSALIACAKYLIDSLVDPANPNQYLAAKLDNLTLGNLNDYRTVASPDSGVLLFPDPTNPVQVEVPGTPVTPPVPANFPTSTTFASNGYFLMLAPLSKGTHYLTFSGGPFSGDYVLIVGQ